MGTQEFNQLESSVLEIMQGIEDARSCYYNENWLSDAMYKQVFIEKVKELKNIIDEATKESIL